MYYGGKSFFVGAKHCLENLAAGDNVHLRGLDGWKSFRVREAYSCKVGNDVCIFSLEDYLFVNPIETKIVSWATLGYPVIYLGFPHGLDGNYPGQDNWPTPLAKVAFLSGSILLKGVRITVYDGINNPGFSGGPVLGNTDNYEAVIVGVISGYRYERRLQGQIYRRIADDREEEKVENHYVKLNSGMIYTTPISVVSELSRDLEHGNPVQIL